MLSEPSSEWNPLAYRSGDWRSSCSRSAPDAGHAPRVEVILDDPRGSNEVTVARDRVGDPVDVGRLEGRDLAQRVTAELAELDWDRTGLCEVRRGRRVEVAHARASQRARGIRCARRLRRLWFAAQRRLVGHAVRPMAVGRGLVARRERLGEVEPRSHWPARSRPGWAGLRAA